jgi:hypothetical protein
MKLLLSIALLFLLSSIAFSQNAFEDLLKYPLAADRESEVYLPPGPINTNPSNILFFNINISQNSAPQNEPSVGISRKDPNRVVAAWRDFRYGVDPVANRRVGYSYSTNGGLTWSNSALLDSTLIPGYTRNSDPVVAVDTAGNFYISVITITFPTGDLALAIYKSTDGGVTFPNAYMCASGGTEDKEWLTSDLSFSSPYVNTLYITWTRFAGGTGIKLTKSVNGGVNWTAPVSISDGTNVQGSNVAVSRNGQINVTWLGFSFNATVMYDRSTNGGASFGTDVAVATGPFPSGLPNNVNSFPFIDVDRSTGPFGGMIYIVFADNRNGDCDVFLCRSTNAGMNWSTPLRVNNDPIGNGKIQYWPCIAVNETGNISIIFMDTRNTPNNTIIEAFLARSTDGGLSFTNELISNEQSPTSIPGSNVRFGDYIDVDYAGTKVVPVWTDERLGGFNQEIYTSEINEFLPVEPVSGTVPDEFNLGQNYPNPFNPTTKIRFDIPSSKVYDPALTGIRGKTVRLAIYDLLGREVTELINGEFNAGKYEITFDGTKYSAGVYFYKLITSEYTETRKMVLVK